MPELCLLTAVIQMALRYLQKPRRQAEAQVFIVSGELEVFCDWPGWDADVIRQAAAGGVAAAGLGRDEGFFISILIFPILI